MDLCEVVRCGGVWCPVPQSAHTLIGALSRRPGPVPFSANNREPAKHQLRYENDKSQRLQKRLWAFVECLIAVVAVETEDGLHSRVA